MKESTFLPHSDQPGLIQAFLELDEGTSGSDEEFLDFQFRIADANASLRERESSEHMADWRASFASLQLKQAHEVAEFALARRREDELRLERQAKEINVLRRSLEAKKLETEQMTVNCALVTKEKLKVEEELAHQLNVCDRFRANVNELSQAQERMCGDNMELRRALDEAVVTTGTLKVALEEKASELVAWLGHEGLGPLELAPVATEDELSPVAHEKKAYTVQAVETARSMDSQELEALFTGEEELQGIAIDDTSKKGDILLTSVTEKMIIAMEEDFEDMKHEVFVGVSKNSESREDSQVCCGSPEGTSGVECVGKGQTRLSPKGKATVVNLKLKIKELQRELEILKYLENVLDEQQPNDVAKNWLFKRGLYCSISDEIEGHDETKYRESDSFSMSEEAEIEARESTLTICDTTEMCTEVVGDQIPGGKLQKAIFDPRLGVSNESGMTADQLLCESMASLEVAPLSSQIDSEDKFICISRNQPWSVVTISKLVENITEELTKLLRVVVQTPNASTQSGFTELEARVKSWSNITTKALESKVSRAGAVEEWKCLVVDFLSEARQELMGVQQRLCDCESELSLMDKLQADCLAASQNMGLLKDEVHRLEAQSFSDHIEKEVEVNLLKEELEQVKQLVAEAERKAVEEQKNVIVVREQLSKAEVELENSKLGWIAEQDFIDSCLEGGMEQPDTVGKVISGKKMGQMEKKLEEMMYRLEENDRELGELLIISGTDPESVTSAKVRRLEQRLGDVKAAKVIVEADRAELASQVTVLKTKLREVEHELQLESQQNVDMLIRYEEERGRLEDSTRSSAEVVSAKLLHMEQLLAEKTRQLEHAKEGHGVSPAQIQLLPLHERLLPIESNSVITRQDAGRCEAASKSKRSKGMENCTNLESKFIALQSSCNTLKTQLVEIEQKERRAQSKIEKLMVELGIAKEEVLKYEVRLQKTLRQAKEDIEAEKRKHEETVSSQKQMEWHLCRQLEVTEGLEREKAKLREVLVEFELQNLALEKENNKLRTAYMQLARQT